MGVVPLPAFSARARLAAVDVIEAHVVRDGLGLPAGYEVAVEGGIAAVEIGLTYRFTVEVSVYDEQRAGVAKVKAVVNVTYAVEDAPRPEDPQAQQFGTVVGFNDVYPYVRQLAAELTAKIGLPPITLDVAASMKIGEPEQHEEADQ